MMPVQSMPDSSIHHHSRTELEPKPVNTGRGSLVLNADDWGRDAHTTNTMLDCINVGTVSSVSAMVFMEDSARAADIGREQGIDVGLHLNFTTSFSQSDYPPQLMERHQKLARYLRRHRMAQIMFHPGLTNTFEYVVQAQMDEYQRLYGVRPGRIDGHHHMHLCANVLFQKLLPPQTLVRRNFSFQAGEKGILNRSYRRCIDAVLKRRHRVADYLFQLLPLEPSHRLQRIFALGGNSIVEVETHPVNADEYRFLMEGEILQLTGGIPVASHFIVPDDSNGR
jgi:predicted glycoside hydrolase/deacetylase ChbG (UPF0249 family)